MQPQAAHVFGLLAIILICHCCRCLGDASQASAGDQEIDGSCQYSDRTIANNNNKKNTSAQSPAGLCIGDDEDQLGGGRPLTLKLAAGIGRQRRGSIEWMYSYFDEQKPLFELKVRDETLDERLSNTAHLAKFIKLVRDDGYRFDSPHPGENRRLEQLAAGPKVNDVQCTAHLEMMLAQMAEMKTILGARRQVEASGGGGTGLQKPPLAESHIRLARVLDSFGRYEAGSLTGRTHFLGSYKQCKSSQMLLGGESQQPQLVGGQYCTAKLDISKHQDESLRAHELEGGQFLSVAMCLPESCHTRNFHENRHLIQALLDSQFELPASMFQDQHLKLDSVFCEIHEDSELVQVPPSGKILLTILIVWCAAVIYATYYANTTATATTCDTECKPNETKRLTVSEKIIDCMDLKRSWDDFVGVNAPSFEGPQHRVSLDVVNPIKVLGCLVVLLGHSFMSSLVFGQDPIKLVKETEYSPTVFAIMNATTIVDTFYVITGILLAYSTMKKLHQREKTSQLDGGNETTLLSSSLRFAKQCLGFAGNRYLRLVPLYFLVFWFKKSILTTLSAGPLWDYGYNQETLNGACRAESWLTPFTFMAAYLPLHKQCLPHTWSVAGDLFFAVMVAPIVIMMTRAPKLAGLISVLACLASNSAMLASVSSIDPLLVEDVKELKFHAIARTFRTLSHLYTAPHYRVFSVIVGLLAGYALYHYNRATDRSSSLNQWPDWFRGPATKASLTLIALMVFVPPLVPLIRNNLLVRYPIHRELFVHMMTTLRLMWAASNATVMMRMMTDWKDSAWMRSSSGQFWRSAARLNYAILLVHMDILILDQTLQLSVGYYSLYSVFRMFASAYVLCVPLAVFLHTVFESPIERLIKTLVL